VEHVRVATEDLADCFRVGEHHEVAVAGNAECKGVPVAAAALVEKAEGVAAKRTSCHQAGALGPGGRAKAGRDLVADIELTPSQRGTLLNG
jgi:hypothetical protein